MQSPDVRAGKPSVRQERCSRVRFAGASCERCLAGCPTASIRIAYPDPALTIDDTCSGCGCCAALCPNEVFGPPRGSPARPADDHERPGPLYCSGLLAAAPVPAWALPPSVVPCLGSISTAFLLDHVVRHGEPLDVVTGSCGECAMTSGEKAYRRREGEIKSLFDYLGIGFSPARVRVGSAPERQEVSRKREAFRADAEASKALSRRAFFGRLGSVVASGPRPATRDDARPGEVASENGGPTGETRSLVDFVRRFAGGAAAEKGPVPGFTEVRVDEGCTGCGACAGLCRAGAIELEEGPDVLRLKWTPAHCSHCGLCFDVCTRKALHLLPCLDAGRIAAQTTSTIKVFERHVCQACGKDFLSSGAGARCEECSKTASLVEAFSAMIYGEGRRTAP